MKLRQNKNTNQTYSPKKNSNRIKKLNYSSKIPSQRKLCSSFPDIEFQC